MTNDLTLEARDGLPDALRVLLQTYPRDTWPAHSNFAGLVAFWLDRHLFFRNLLTHLITETEAVIDAKTDPQTYAANLSRGGSALLQNLHNHHNIEDHHYFPVLSTWEAPLERGFRLLDADHHAMDGLLNRFADGANAVIQGTTEPGPFREDLLSFQAMLNRHLIDEEELIVPVILKHGPGGLS